MSPSDLPAILGGRAVRPEGPPVWPRADAEIEAAVAAALAAGAWGQYHGKQVVGLEAELAAFHNVPHAITCASGTLAVEAALRALRIGPGDEVVLAAYDFESNFLTVHAIGAKPVLVDVAVANWNLDPGNLEAAFTPQTKAVICSHLHGGIVPMREVMAIARRHGVGVVEDAAQAPGAKVQGQPSGTWGDVGTLSFGGSKLLCSGRGGALFFRDPQLHQRAKVWLHRGLQQWAPLSELQAAAIRPQLRRLPERTLERAARVQTLVAMLEKTGVPGLVLFGNAAGDCVPAFYKVGFRYDAAAFGLPRDLFVKALRAEGIAFDEGFGALHINRSSSRFRGVGELSTAAAADAGCVTLHHPVLWGSTAEVRQVADAVERIYRHRESVARGEGSR